MIKKKIDAYKIQFIIMPLNIKWMIERNKKKCKKFK